MIGPWVNLETITSGSFQVSLGSVTQYCVRGKLGALILVLQNSLIVPFSSPALQSRSDKETVPQRCFSFSAVLVGLILVAAWYKPHFSLAVSRLVALKRFWFVDP